jgi:DNA-binding LacI/PurR family transcriptional regulator
VTSGIRCASYRQLGFDPSAGSSYDPVSENVFIPLSLEEESVEDASWRPATMAQVAADAGVSIPTVSRVINASAPVAIQTRQTVLNSIERLRYHPNPMARGLSRGHSDIVLVVLPHVTEPSIAMRLSGLINVLRSSPYEIHLVDVEQPPDKRIRSIGEIVLQNRPAGVIIISMPPDESDFQAFSAAGVPTVLVDTPPSGVPSDTVDDIAGGELATQHLIALGHTKIAFLGDQEETAIGVPASANRRRGYERALAKAGLELRSEYVRTGPHGLETATALAAELMGLADPPTAIFAFSDVQALGVMAAARSLDVRIPDRLSVIGFDDIDAAALTGLTTVRQPLEISGRRAALRLLKMLGHSTQEAMPGFPALEVVVRNTTGPAISTSQEPLSVVSSETVDMATKVAKVLTPAARQVQQVPRRK